MLSRASSSGPLETCIGLPITIWLIDLNLLSVRIALFQSIRDIDQSLQLIHFSKKPSPSSQEMSSRSKSWTRKNRQWHLLDSMPSGFLLLMRLSTPLQDVMVLKQCHRHIHITIQNMLPTRRLSVQAISTQRRSRNLCLETGTRQGSFLMKKLSNSMSIFKTRQI